MTALATHDPLRSALEIREQLSSDKRRVAFFMGAGTSMAVGLPGIDELTSSVAKRLGAKEKKSFEAVRAEMSGSPNIEAVLNRIRLCRELLAENANKTVDGLSAVTASELDVAICRAICDIVSVDPPKGLKTHAILAQWLHALHRHRERPVEIFTTNYDLLFERAMEDVGLPFFDGFVGAVAPFFAPESVEGDGTEQNASVHPPRCWTRLWKLHGSIGWQMRKDSLSGRARITRTGNCRPSDGDELIIFPSRDKYSDSRKLPFIAYQDRLRRFLMNGEALFVLLGYSFSDQHLNDIIFQGLRSNTRLAVCAFMHGVKTKGKDALSLPEDVVGYGTAHRNLSIFGPDRAVIGGVVGAWCEPSRKPKAGDEWPFWHDIEKRFTLGDFTAMTGFLERFIGFDPASKPAAAKDDLTKAPRPEANP